MRKIPVTLKKGSNTLPVDLSNITPGMYYLYFKGSDTWLKTTPFMKL